MKAIILAGGKGSRFEPFTLSHPKVLYPVAGKPMIFHVLDYLPPNISEVIITVCYKADDVVGVVGDVYNGKAIHYAYQDPQDKGTWSALYAARDYFDSQDELCLVVSGDDVFDASEVQQLVQLHKPLFGVHEKILPAKYHGMRIDGNGNIAAFERHQNQDREEMVRDVFACGLYVVPAAVFGFEPQQLIDGEWGLPQTLLARYDSFKMHVAHLSTWFSLNTPAEVVQYEHYLESKL